MINKQDKTIWYKDGYVLMLIAFPLAAVIGGIITAILAVQSDDGLVVDDYYKRGLEINKTLEREHNASRHGLTANISMDGELIIRLGAAPEYTLPDFIRVSFLHPTRSGQDVQLLMDRTVNSDYRSPVPELSRGNWYIQIEAEDWRLLERYQID